MHAMNSSINRNIKPIRMELRPILRTDRKENLQLKKAMGDNAWPWLTDKHWCAAVAELRNKRHREELAMLYSRRSLNVCIQLAVRMVMNTAKLFHRQILQAASEYGDATALTDAETGEHLSFAELRRRSFILAHVLHREYNVRKGDIVICFMPNSIHYPIVFLASALCGASLTGVNPEFLKTDLMDQLHKTQAKCVFTTSELVGLVSEATRGTNTPTFVMDKVAGQMGIDYEKLIHDAVRDDDPALDLDIEEDDVLLTPLSSGTTGAPKCVMLTHRNFNVQTKILKDCPSVGWIPLSALMSARLSVRQLLRGHFRAIFDKLSDMGGGRRATIAFLPFYHVSGFWALCYCLLSGHQTVVMQKFQAPLLLSCIEDYKSDPTSKQPAQPKTSKSSPPKSPLNHRAKRSPKKVPTMDRATNTDRLTLDYNFGASDSEDEGTSGEAGDEETFGNSDSDGVPTRTATSSRWTAWLRRKWLRTQSNRRNGYQAVSSFQFPLRASAQKPTSRNLFFATSRRSNEMDISERLLSLHFDAAELRNRAGIELRRNLMGGQRWSPLAAPNVESAAAKKGKSKTTFKYFPKSRSGCSTEPSTSAGCQPAPPPQPKSILKNPNRAAAVPSPSTSQLAAFTVASPSSPAVYLTADRSTQTNPSPRSYSSASTFVQSSASGTDLSALSQPSSATDSPPTTQTWSDCEDLLSMSDDDDDEEEEHYPLWDSVLSYDELPLELSPPSPPLTSSAEHSLPTVRSNGIMEDCEQSQTASFPLHVCSTSPQPQQSAQPSQLAEENRSRRNPNSASPAAENQTPNPFGLDSDEQQLWNSAVSQLDDAVSALYRFVDVERIRSVTLIPLPGFGCPQPRNGKAQIPQPIPTSASPTPLTATITTASSASGQSAQPPYPHLDSAEFNGTSSGGRPVSHRVDVLNVVPSIITFLLKNETLVREFDLSSVRTVLCGSAPMPRDQTLKFLTKFKHVLNFVHVAGYGMTEIVALSHLSPLGMQWDGDKQLGTCGKLLPEFECKVVNIMTNEEITAPRESGELWLRSQSVMKGYMNDPAATALAIDSDGWLHTGDIVYFDEDRYFYVVERLTNVIKVNGMQVSPSELETLMLSHPNVLEAAVIGVASEDFGEVPRAFVVLRSNPKNTESIAELRAFVHERVSTLKQLRGGIRIVASLPRTAAGKIRYEELRRLSLTTPSASDSLNERAGDSTADPVPTSSTHMAPPVTPFSGLRIDLTPATDEEPQTEDANGNELRDKRPPTPAAKKSQSVALPNSAPAVAEGTDDALL